MIGDNKSVAPRTLARVWRFLQRPWLEKWQALGVRWRKWLPRIPFPIRLSFGSWWLARNDQIGAALLQDTFEDAEHHFVKRFLQAGMTVIDAGAHQGFYTLLASTRVGPQGKVFAFEPSPRETKALRRHIGINRCVNVKTERLALGSRETEATLFVVQGVQTGCNSLRIPAADVTGDLNHVKVRVVRLDHWLDTQRVSQVDFVKIDVEGAELEVLKGAQKLLHSRPRPVLLIEVQDTRTKQWGYSAREIIFFLANQGFKWLDLSPDGTCAPLDTMRNRFEGNYVACPAEREQEVRQLFGAL